MNKEQRKNKSISELTASRVCVAGLGTVGLPTALHISKFFDVVGFDVNPEAVKRSSSCGIRGTYGSLPLSSVYVLTVSTSCNKDEPDMSAVYNVCHKIAQLKLDALVCVESTVSVGTCRNLAETVGLKNLVHCPHRFWPKDPVNHGVVQPRILGAIDEQSLKIGKEFYDLLKIPVHPVSSIEIAEISKIAENAYRFVQISFAEELKIMCDKLQLSFKEVREACNTKWNIEVLEALQGIGGTCLPKDIRFLIYSGKMSSLLSGAIKADAEYIEWNEVRG